jgi:undecaprenyl-diphosphatase
LGWPVDDDRTRFTAGLHAGSTVGLAWALRRDLTGRRLGWMALSAVPAAAAGYLGQDAVERRLGRPGPTAALLAGAGVLLLVADRSSGSRPARTKDVAVAALAQVPALAPGVSRAGATLTALRARGVARDEAARLSLLMSLPIAAGASMLTAVRGRQAPPVVPTLVSGAAAYAAARRLRVSAAFVPASVAYRLVIAAAVAARLRKERP